MILRRQLPAWSPLTAGALGAALWPPADAFSRIEGRIAQEYEPSSMLLVRSGTAALALGFLASAREGHRPRIGLPAWGCFDLMTAADSADAEVLFYDLEPCTLAPEAESFRRMLGRQPHAVVVVHWFGIPVDLRPLAKAVNSAGAVLIDDAAQAVGATIGGKPAGAGGDFGVLSFGRGKGRTGGEGGAILATTPEAAARLHRASANLAKGNSGLRSYAALWAQWALGRPHLYGVPASLPGLRLGETVYRRPTESRLMTSRSAVVLDAVWALSAEEVNVRRRNAARWQRLVGESAALTAITTPPDTAGGWLRFPILAGDAIRSRLNSSRARRHGIMPGYPVPLGKLPVAPGRIVSRPDAFAGASSLSERLVTLPTHRMVGESEFTALAELLD